MGDAKIVMHVVNPYTSNTTMMGRLKVYILHLRKGVENQHGMPGRDMLWSNQIVDMITNMGVRPDECNHGHQTLQVCRHVGFR